MTEHARTAPPWPDLLGDPGEPCGYTHADHTADGQPDGPPLVCVRAEGHPGGPSVPARDQHLADVDGQPVFFGEPLAFDAEGAP